ncbi:3'-5' exonuclease [Culex quinquefasciatus]|nr:3'-5' exonuclease [Culex quinquefasciatus]|eukprot:XP_001855491.1 3'-5' exonuclease [Culex quinquefasciatus]
MTLPLRLADALGDYNFELSVKAAYVNHIPTYLDKEYVESMSPHTQHTLFNNDIHVVSSPEHCRWVISKLREEMICYRNRIGFDFHHGILQLATPNGICALIRLDYINDIPWELRKFLKDENISKWTFDVLRKTRDLFESYFLQINNVAGEVAGQYLSDPTRKALIAVAKVHLNFDLGEVVRIQNGIELTDEEIQYCAGNVIAYAKLSNRSNVCKSTNYTNQVVTHMVFGHNIYVVNTTERCRIVAKKLREVTKDFPFLGFDCEWLPWNPRGPITLLQLAGGKGSQRLCVLVRLCYDFEIPQELLDLLNDPKIIKAGVESIRDAQFLDQDYGFTVQGAIDLRFLYPQTHQQQPIGLAALAEKELHVYLNKDKAITLSGFNQPILSYEQIQYAAGDAIVGANLFDKFWQKCNKSMDQIQPFLDIPFFVKKCTQPATLVRNNGGGQNSQFTGHRTFESLVPPTGVFQNSVTQENVQQPPKPRSKKRSRNKKK